MLGNKNTRKPLEKVITYDTYKNAKDVKELLQAAYDFLNSQKKEVKFRDEYNATSKYYDSKKRDFEIIIESYSTGNIMDALKKLYDILVDTDANKLKLKIETLKKNTPLYRMRSQKGYKLYQRKEMFHIPKNMTYGVPNYRYSLNGFPCLYLGASLYVCWEETRRSDIDKVNYVKIAPTKDLQFITTTCPEKFENEDDVIQFFVFALCTKMADNDNDKFQFQYAFPELLLHLLINFNHTYENGYAYGIKYVSARYFENDGQFSSEPIFYNYVIPTYEPIDEKDHLSKELKATFKVSEVKAFYVNLIYERMPSKALTRPYEYANTHFKLLEDELEAPTALDRAD